LGVNRARRIAWQGQKTQENIEYMKKFKDRLRPDKQPRQVIQVEATASRRRPKAPDEDEESPKNDVSRPHRY